LFKKSIRRGEGREVFQKLKDVCEINLNQRGGLWTQATFKREIGGAVPLGLKGRGVKGT